MLTDKKRRPGPHGWKEAAGLKSSPEPQISPLWLWITHCLWAAAAYKKGIDGDGVSHIEVFPTSGSGRMEPSRPIKPSSRRWFCSFICRPLKIWFSFPKTPLPTKNISLFPAWSCSVVALSRTHHFHNVCLCSRRGRRSGTSRNRPGCRSRHAGKGRSYRL